MVMNSIEENRQTFSSYRTIRHLHLHLHLHHDVDASDVATLTRIVSYVLIGFSCKFETVLSVLVDR